jgi:fatty acid-binding protein DegV
MKQYRNLIKPYLVWAFVVIVIPLILIALYAFTEDGNEVLTFSFTLENFDNLIKNGRMRPIVGTLLRSLGIHIIADATAEGTIHVADKARGVGKTYRAITALMKASKDCTDAEVVISHCENLEGAMALKRQILADLPVKQVDLLSCRGLTSFYAMEKGLIVGY